MKKFILILLLFLPLPAAAFWGVSEGWVYESGEVEGTEIKSGKLKGENRSAMLFLNCKKGNVYISSPGRQETKMKFSPKTESLFVNFDDKRESFDVRFNKKKTAVFFVGEDRAKLLKLMMGPYAKMTVSLYLEGGRKEGNNAEFELAGLADAWKRCKE